MKPIPTQDQVKEIYDYNNGALFWKKKTAVCVKIGERAGYLKKDDNYILIRVNKHHYYLHKIIYLWHTGIYPEFLDHKDRNRSNCRIENLRESSRRENNCNRCSAKGSTSKYLGVHLKSGRMVWCASIRVNRKLMHIKNTISQEEAALAYNREAVRYHGEFANLNIIKNG